MKTITKVIILTCLFLIPFNIQSNTKQSISINSNYQIPLELFPNAIVETTFTGTINVTCFSGPDAAYDLIYNSLLNAQTEFYLEVYTLSSEPLVNGLIAANDRGVDVQVSLSHDRVNPYEDNYTLEAAYRLDQAGAIVTWCNTSFAYTHAKFWIVDQQLAFVYSGNWAPSSIPQVSNGYTNREMGFMFDDSSIATYYRNVFLDDQLIGNPYAGTELHNGILQANVTTGSYTHPFDTPSTFNEPMEVTPIFAPDISYDLLSELIDSANFTIDLELQYISTTCDLLPHLLAAAGRGVSIRVLIPEPSSSSHNVTQTLIENGISVRFFKGLDHNHNKYICVDGIIVSVSSINWSDNSIYNNRESGANVKNANVATYFTTIFDFDWNKGEIPIGYVEALTIMSPSLGEVVSDSHNFQVIFSTNNYTSGILYIDDVLVHIWANPNGTESHLLDTTSYTDGIHNVKVIGTPDVGSPVIVEHDFNIVNLENWWVLVSEVRYDAVDETEGEFFELYNGFTFDVAIGGWKVTDGEGTYTIPEGVVFDADDILVFVRDATVFVAEMTDLVVSTVYDHVYSDLILANIGDELILQDSKDNILDACIWGTGSLAGHTPWTGSMDDTKSLQRDPANHDTDDCLVDFIVRIPNPGTVYVTESKSFNFITVFFASSILLVIAVYVKRK